MRFSNYAVASVAATAVLCGFSQVAQANNTITQLTGTTPAGTSDISFTQTGANTGTLQTVAGGANVSAVGPIGGPTDTFASFFNFTSPLQLVAGSAATTNGVVTATFGPNSGFTLFTGANSTGTLLLSGTFANVSFTSPSGSSAGLASIGLNTVNYTGGLFRTEFQTLYGGPQTVGTFSLSLSAINPVVTASGGALSSFGAQAISGTLDATPAAVPEPSEWLAMGMAATSVGGLMFRAKRKLKTSRQQVAA